MASLCASCCWAAPVTAAAASPSSRPDRVTLRGRSAPSPPPLLNIQPGRRPRGAFFLSGCQKGPHRHFEPEPEPESELGREDGDPNSFIKNLDKYRDDYRAKLGLHVPPKMFCKQKDEICEYMEKILGSKNLNNNNWMAVTVCHKARSALDLASTVMDIPSVLGLGTREISQHTTDQMVRLYAATFCNAVEDACRQGVDKDTILTFLRALACLGAIAHILVEDMRAKLKDGPLKNKITFRLDTYYHEFSMKMDALKTEIALAEPNDAGKIMDQILRNGVMHAESYVSKLIDVGSSLY